MRFVFLHIDRTGGMAVREWLAQHFDYNAIRPVAHHPQTRLQPTNYPLDFNTDLFAQHRHFQDDGWPLVMGHWDVGILDRMKRTPKTLTVLRDPVERAASLWRYIAKEPMYEALGAEAQTLGMMGFLLKYRGLWANVMTAQLAGIRWSGLSHSYQRAFEAIEMLDYVGVTEYLDDFVSYVGQCEGFEVIYARHINSTPPLPIAPTVRAMIMTESPLDMRLYELARKRCLGALQQSRIG